jgi:hypothetical protein
MAEPTELDILNAEIQLAEKFNNKGFLDRIFSSRPSDEDALKLAQSLLGGGAPQGSLPQALVGRAQQDAAELGGTSAAPGRRGMDAGTARLLRGQGF